MGAFPGSLELAPRFLSASMLPNLAASLAVCATGKKEIREKSVSSSDLNNSPASSARLSVTPSPATLIRSDNIGDLRVFFHNYLFNLVIEGNASPPSVTNSAEVKLVCLFGGCWSKC